MRKDGVAVKVSRVLAGAFILAAALPGPARAVETVRVEAAAACKKAGTLDRCNAGDGATYFPASGERMFVLCILDKDFASRSELSRPAFMIDGILYQFVFVPIAKFSPGARPSDADLLLAHARWEFEAARRAGSPLDQFVDLGNKHRPASEGREAVAFKLWRRQGADDSVTQAFDTAIVGDEVVAMSAIHPAAQGRPEQFRGCSATTRTRWRGWTAPAIDRWHLI